MTSSREEDNLGFHPWMALIAIVCLSILGIYYCVVYFARNGEEGQSRVGSELANLVYAIAFYKDKYGVYPSGTDAQVSQALTGGGNEKSMFIRWNRRRIGKMGEFLDPWNQPIHFDMKAGTVRSSGPNRTLGDSDDFVVNFLQDE